MVSRILADIYFINLDVEVIGSALDYPLQTLRMSRKAGARRTAELRRI